MELYKDIVTCTKEVSLQSLAKSLIDNSVRHVFVVDDDKRLIGVAGTADIVSAVAEGKETKGLPVKEIMKKAEAVKLSMEPEFAYALMRRFNTLICPVVDENNVLLGYYKFAEVCEKINSKLMENN